MNGNQNQNQNLNQGNNASNELEKTQIYTNFSNVNQIQNNNNINTVSNPTPIQTPNVTNIQANTQVAENSVNSNQTPNNVINTPSNTVPPINEVKTSSEVPVTNVNNVVNQAESETNNMNPSEPPKNSKVSTILLVLLFVFLFVFIMGMPYINEFVDKFKSNAGLSEIEKQAKEEEERQKEEAEKNNPSNKPQQDKTNTLVCTANVLSTDTYTLNGVQKLHYNSKNQILKADTIFKYTFTTQDATYASLKKQCEEDSLKYLTHSGFSMGCTSNETNIEMTYEFDLETFTPITDGNTTISTTVTYKQDLTALKNDLISQGFTCE